MEKHNIYELYVVRIQNDCDHHYLLCRYNELSNTYVEIFTKKIIKISNDLNVEPLFMYSSISSKYSDSTGKSFILDQTELLSIYIEINKSNLKKDKLEIQDERMSTEENEILKKATLSFFPKDGHWRSNCFKKPKEIQMNNLPWR